nr:histone deacetylase 14 [Tanacetum cinerariifolium]
NMANENVPAPTPTMIRYFHLLYRKHNLRQRYESLVHLAEEDLRPGNLKFVPKGKDDEVFGMKIPNELITEGVRRAHYYKGYLEMLAKHEQKIAAEKKVVQGQAHVGDVAIRELIAEASRPLPMVEGKGKEIAIEEQVAQSMLALHTLKKRIRETPSPADAETDANIDKKSQTFDNTTQNLRSRVFTLGLWDLPHKFNQTVNEVVKEAVHVAFQAPLRDHFRELLEADMKEILHQRMFNSGSYKSLHEHVALYEALEASMERANRDEFLVKKDKSRKRRHDSSAWKTSNTREATSSSSKQKSAPHSEQPVDDVSIPDDIIPPTDLPDAKNNWADALAKSYKDPEENKLLNKTRDMGSFIKWFCKRIGKKKLRKSNLEGPTFKVVKAFHENNISLQFQMEECHWLLTDQVDLVNPDGHRLVPDVSKPLPLGGPPSHVTIQPQLFFNTYLEYLISGDTARRTDLSISKLKAANYLDFRLKELVPSLWIESERDYNISAAYGYAYLREIVIRRADYNEYKISAVDFKNLHLNDFEDLYLLHLQGKLNHLPRSDKVHLYNAINLLIRNIVIRQRVGELQLGIKSYQTKLNLTEPRWDALDFRFK